MLLSLERGLEIMQYLCSHSSVSVSEIADQFHIDRSTASRILSSLRRHGMAVQNSASKKYRLGPVAIALGSRLQQDYPFIESLRPLLQRLSEATGKTALLYMGQGEQAFPIAQAKKGPCRLALPLHAAPEALQSAGYILEQTPEGPSILALPFSEAAAPIRFFLALCDDQKDWQRPQQLEKDWQMLLASAETIQIKRIIPRAFLTASIRKDG